MSPRVLTVEFNGQPHQFRVKLVREEFMVGAHFFAPNQMRGSPLSFVACTSEQSEFEYFSSLSDELLLEACVAEFSVPSHVAAVLSQATAEVSIGRRLTKTTKKPTL